MRTERNRGPVCTGGGDRGLRRHPGPRSIPARLITGAGATTGTWATGGARRCLRCQRYPPAATARTRNSTHPRPLDLRRAGWPSTGIFTAIVARPPPRSLVAVVAKRELLHLGLQRLPADLQELRRARHVAARLLERAGDDLLLQLGGALPDDVLEARLARRGPGAPRPPARARAAASRRRGTADAEADRPRRSAARPRRGGCARSGSPAPGCCPARRRPGPAPAPRPSSPRSACSGDGCTCRRSDAPGWGCRSAAP